MGVVFLGCSRNVMRPDTQETMGFDRRSQIGVACQLGAVIDCGELLWQGRHHGPGCGVGGQFIRGQQLESQVQGIRGAAELEAGPAVCSFTGPDESHRGLIGLSRMGGERVFRPVQVAVEIGIGVWACDIRLIRSVDVKWKLSQP
jgi:hypothetical protein